LGLRSISACLKKAGHTTQIIFLPFQLPELHPSVDFQEHTYTAELLNQVTEFASNADLVGISIMTNYFHMAKDLTLHLKSKLDKPVIWGGIHTSIRPEECLEVADFVCVYEGEDATVELASKLENNEPVDTIPNIWLKKNGDMIKNEIRIPIHDLDSLPFFDYDFENHCIFDNHSQTMQVLDKDCLHRYLTRMTPTKARASLFYQTIASRGCMHTCTFCCWDALQRKYNLKSRVRRRSNRHIIDELKWVRQELPFIREITFSDDSFFSVSKAVAAEFRDMYKSEIGLPFQCLAEPRTITRDRLEIFVDAGLVNIQIGIQTGSEPVKQMYGRTVSNEKIIAMGKMLNEYIPPIRPPIYDMILDNPWETMADKIETLDMLQQIPRPYFLQLFSLTFFPGTTLYDRAKAEGMIEHEHEEIYKRHYNRQKITYVNVLFSLFSRNFPMGILKILCKPSVVRIMSRLTDNYVLKILYTTFAWLRYGVTSLKQKTHPKSSFPEPVTSESNEVS